MECKYICRSDNKLYFVNSYYFSKQNLRSKQGCLQEKEAPFFGASKRKRKRHHSLVPPRERGTILWCLQEKEAPREWCLQERGTKRMVPSINKTIIKRNCCVSYSKILLYFYFVVLFNVFCF